MLNYAFTWLTAAKDIATQNPISAIICIAVVLVIIAGVVVFAVKKK